MISNLIDQATRKLGEQYAEALGLDAPESIDPTDVPQAAKQLLRFLPPTAHRRVRILRGDFEALPDETRDLLHRLQILDLDLDRATSEEMISMLTRHLWRVRRGMRMFDGLHPTDCGGLDQACIHCMRLRTHFHDPADCRWCGTRVEK